MMKMMKCKRRFPAEWEKCGAILIAAPDLHTDWKDVINLAIDQYQKLVSAFTEAGENVILLCRNKEKAASLYPSSPNGKVVYLEADYNDTWTRDYGPIITETPDGFEINDFGFNAWGLKFAADKDNLINRFFFENNLFSGIYNNHLSFIFEGGSIESDGKGIGMTTSECLLSANRNGSLSKEQIEKYLKLNLGFDKLLWVNHGFLAGDDTDSHIDTLARICPNSTIAYVACDDPSDEHYCELKKMESEINSFADSGGCKFKTVPLPLPDPIYDSEGLRLPATYANYLVTDRNIFIPIYNQPEKDSKAVEALSKIFPGRNIVTVDCTTLILQHGSLHCSTMQIPYDSLNKIF